MIQKDLAFEFYMYTRREHNLTLNPAQIDMVEAFFAMSPGSGQSTLLRLLKSFEDKGYPTC